MTDENKKPHAGGRGASDAVGSGERQPEYTPAAAALMTGIELIHAAGRVSQDEHERLAGRHEELLAIAKAQRPSLDTPLPDPLEVYHPKHIETRVDKKSGLPEFVRAKGTVDNLARLVEAYGVKVRYNELARDIEVSVLGRDRMGELARNTNIALIEDLCRINGYPHTQVMGNIFALAERNSYNPALEWIKSKPWDGVPRFGDLFDCMELVSCDHARVQLSWCLFQKWLLGATAILSGKASKFEHVLVLVDPTGGIGKTRFFNTFCPPQWQSDGVALNVHDKDSVLSVISKWIVELGEIGATFSRSDNEALKAFLSRSEDEVRPPYGRAANRYARRTAFFGSVNNIRFLADDTNNRRFWPIEVKAINYRHDIDMQQVWAEALDAVQRGHIYHLTPRENEAVGALNESFRSMDRIEESILTLYDPGGNPCRYLSATQVLEEIGVLNAKRVDTNKASAVLGKLFAKKLSHNVTVYHMPQQLSSARRLSPVRHDWADSSPL